MEEKDEDEKCLYLPLSQTTDTSSLW